MTGFVGPNGAGKSTTMRMVLGLATPDAGRVTVNGEHYANWAAPLRVVGALPTPLRPTRVDGEQPSALVGA